MIYSGLIDFHPSPSDRNLVKSVLKSYSTSLLTIISKPLLTLSCGKLSNNQDVDELYETDSSLMLGRAFLKGNGKLSREAFQLLVKTSPEEFLKTIWGKYIFFTISQDLSTVEITLDPTGQLPFYYYRYPNGNILFASDIEIIAELLGKNPDFNWAYLSSYLVYGNSCAEQTPFDQIYEIPPGCTLTLSSKEKKTNQFWDPLRAYEKREIHRQEPVQVLHNTMAPWIEPYKNIIVSLSGGLDSSTLIYCLKDLVKSDQELHAINYFHSQVGSSNELISARKVCKDVGVSLKEIDVSSALPFEPFQNPPLIKPNKPFPGLISLRWMELVFEQIPVDNPFVWVSGHGSDNLFMRPPSKNSLSDYLLEKGFHNFPGPLNGISQFYRDPVLPILRKNLASLINYFLAIKPQDKRIKSKSKELPPWYTEQLIESSTSTFSHPVHQFLPKRVLPGKYDQIHSLYRGLASIQIELTNPSNPTFFPFLYQPVVELCLSFPVYDLFSKGYDRYPLRKAVSDRYQTDTVWRRDKSQTTGLFQLGVKKHLKEVLELCLDGHFVKENLINKEGLSKTIHLICNGDIRHLWPFIHLASAEMFLQTWKKQGYPNRRLNTRDLKQNDLLSV